MCVLIYIKQWKKTMLSFTKWYAGHKTMKNVIIIIIIFSYNVQFLDTFRIVYGKIKLI